jgi:opacity protein-like surface antigen
MRSVKSLVAAGAASLLSTVAFAADMPSIMPAPMYAPAPVEEFGGWYLRGDIGFSNQNVSNIRKSNVDYSTFGSFTEAVGFDSGGIFDVGAGYRFNSWLRGDVTAQYRGRSSFHGSDVFTFPAGLGVVGNGIDNYSGSKSEWLFLANAYVDLGTWWCVTPFIGAGVGTSRVTIANFTDNGLTDQAGFPPVSGIYPSGATASNASKWNFAWAAHAGLAYKVSSNVTLELAYSYVDLGSGTTGAISDFQGNTRGAVYKFNDITSHDLKLGVRWQLDSPPAYAPPLVRKG